MSKVKLKTTIEVEIIEDVPQEVFKEYAALSQDERVKGTEEMLKEGMNVDSVKVLSYDYAVLEESPDEPQDCNTSPD